MNSKAYTVEIDASAWSQLAVLRVETYRRVCEALRCVASALTRDGDEAPAGGPLRIDGTVARYDVDSRRRRVLLREIDFSPREA